MRGRRSSLRGENIENSGGMQDLFMDDFDVFDGSGRDESDEFMLETEGRSAGNHDGDSNNSNDGDQKHDALSEEVIASLTPVDTNLERLRRAGQEGNGGLPLPTWQSETDRNHRQAMILDM